MFERPSLLHFWQTSAFTRCRRVQVPPIALGTMCSPFPLSSVGARQYKHGRRVCMTFQTRGPSGRFAGVGPRHAGFTARMLPVLPLRKLKWLFVAAAVFIHDPADQNILLRQLTSSDP